MNDRQKTTSPLKDNSSLEDTPENMKETKAKEIGGRRGPEPTRYGDWENNGIASDF